MWGLVPWILIGTLEQDRRDPSWVTALAQGKYEATGQALRGLPDATGLKDLGSQGLALLRLDLKSARQVLRGLRSGGGGPPRLTGLLEGLIASHRGDPLPMVARLRDLLEDPAYRVAVLPFVGRGALQMCRGGDAEGIRILERILTWYPAADWAKSNLANGYRFVGRYEKALEIFDTLIRDSGRQAWYLNGKALVHQARFERDEALALFLEGGQDSCVGVQADRLTNRTNAAVLLISRGGKADLQKAEQLLDSVVSLDPAAIRASYYLRQIQRLRSAGSPR